MPDDGSTQSAAVWPIPKFRFELRWDGSVMPFQEVSGLDVQAQPIEYRRGDSAAFSVMKMSGVRKYSDVTLKKGVVKSNSGFWDWFKQIKMNTVQRKKMTIALLDEAGAPTMVWKLVNAWPTKITSTDLKADGNEVAVETIVIAHEGSSIENT